MQRQAHVAVAEQCCPPKSLAFSPRRGQDIYLKQGYGTERTKCDVVT